VHRFRNYTRTNYCPRVTGRRAPWWDAALYGASALVALATALYDSIPLLADWGRRAIVPYALGALVAALLATSWLRVSDWGRSMGRATILGAVFTGAVLVPLALNIAARQRGPEPHAQSETLLTEEAAAALVRGENPYAVSYENGPLGRWPSEDWLHLPYLPGIVVFGLPHALSGQAPVADARVSFLTVAAAVALVGLRLSKAPRDRLLTAVMVLMVLPPGARYIVGGGDDITVLALMLLALVLATRTQPLAAGVILGLAAAIKQTAWPLLPFLIVAARDRSGMRATGRALAGAGAVLVPGILPFLAWDPAAFVEDTVLYPLGLTEERTLAGSPTIGDLLGRAFPSARGPLLVVLSASVLIVGAYLLIRRTRATAAAAADRTAIVFTLAVLLATAGRFGYLIYPLNLVLWSRLVLRPVERGQDDSSERRAYAMASSTDIESPSASSFS
jgi:Glycosyltransferase family 87